MYKKYLLKVEVALNFKNLGLAKIYGPNEVWNN